MGLQASYDGDVVAWANEQAQLLRAGRFSELDIEHIADEVEDVGKSERRQLFSRMSQLLAHLLKWRYQPERRGRSWLNTIRVQRRAISKHLADMPSLKPTFNDLEWLELMWADAIVMAERETGIVECPETCVWTIDHVMDDSFLPE
jgi:hypothetical protein